MSTQVMQGFPFEGNGTVWRVDVFETKSGKEIVTVIFEVPGDRPKLVPIKFFGKLGQTMKKAKKGEVIHIEGRLSGREWQGRVYLDAEGETASAIGPGEPESHDEVPPPDGETDVPF